MPDNNHSSFLKSRIKSFGYALEGFKTFFGSQPNAQIHLVAMGFVMAMGFGFGIKKEEWIILLLCITLVLMAEAFNTSIEFLTDLVSPEIHPIAKKVKDVAAAAVLICVIGSALIGAFIFWPYLKILKSIL